MKKQALALSLTIVFLFMTFVQLNGQVPARKRPCLTMAGKDFLDLTREQKDRLGELRKARMEARCEFMEKMRDLRQNLRQLMQDPEAAAKKIEKTIDEMARLRADFMKSGIRHREEVKKVFTPEQLEKLRELRKRFVRAQIQAKLRGFGRRAFFRRYHFMPRRHFHRPWRRGWLY